MRRLYRQVDVCSARVEVIAARVCNTTGRAVDSGLCMRVSALGVRIGTFYNDL
jgi:hypothetical protein